jgi:hypothetical protein
MIQIVKTKDGSHCESVGHCVGMGCWGDPSMKYVYVYVVSRI